MSPSSVEAADVITAEADFTGTESYREDLSHVCSIYCSVTDTLSKLGIVKSAFLS